MLDNYAALESSGETAIGLFNAETGRNFAVLMTPGFRFDDVQHEKWLAAELESALETIKVLEDDNALLDIIDAQNDVLQSRVTVDEVEGIVVGDTVEFIGLSRVLRGTVETDPNPTLYIRTPTNEFGNGWRRKPEDVVKVINEVGSWDAGNTYTTLTPEVENLQNGGTDGCNGSGSKMNWSESSEPDSTSEYNREDLQRRISNQRKQIKLLQRQKDDADAMSKDQERYTDYWYRIWEADREILDHYGIKATSLENFR